MKMRTEIVAALVSSIAVLIMVVCTEVWSTTPEGPKEANIYCAGGRCASSVNDLLEDMVQQVYTAHKALAACRFSQAIKVDVAPLNFPNNYVSMGRWLSDDELEVVKKAEQSTYEPVKKAYQEAMEARKAP